jgi:hypothetical protein
MVMRENGRGADINDIVFYSCPSCTRAFALHQKIMRLAEAWPGPISLALYSVLFSEAPSAEATRKADIFAQQNERALCEKVGKEIELELASPVQLVRDILDSRQSEEELRDYLKLFAQRLREKLS